MDTTLSENAKHVFQRHLKNQAERIRRKKGGTKRKTKNLACIKLLGIDSYDKALRAFDLINSGDWASWVIPTKMVSGGPLRMQTSKKLYQVLGLPPEGMKVILKFCLHESAQKLFDPLEDVFQIPAATSFNLVFPDNEPILIEDKDEYEQLLFEGARLRRLDIIPALRDVHYFLYDSAEESMEAWGQRLIGRQGKAIITYIDNDIPSFETVMRWNTHEDLSYLYQDFTQLEALK